MKDSVTDSLLGNTHGEFKMDFEAACITNGSNQNEIKHIKINLEEDIQRDHHGSIGSKYDVQEGNVKDVCVESKKVPLNMFNQPCNITIEDKLISTISPESIEAVDDLIEQINKLSILQKLLLYNKFPSVKDRLDQIDPLSRPLNPLGNRTEVSHALMYIKTHFIPDCDISLPKKEIYNDYVSYCMERKIKRLSTADFGKAMKQVYPVVRARRLGERGNSRYCYSGLSNRGSLKQPITPGFPVGQISDVVSKNICCWASNILNVTVKSLLDLNNIILTGCHSKTSEAEGVRISTVLPTKGENKIVDKKHKLEEGGSDSQPPKSAKQRKICKQTKSQHCKTRSTNNSKRSVGLVSFQTHTGKTQAVSHATKSDKSCDIIYQNTNSVDALIVNNLRTNKLDLKSDKSSSALQVHTNASSTDLTSHHPQTSKITDECIASSNFKTRDCTIEIVTVEDRFSIASIEEGSALDSLSSTNEICKEWCSQGNYCNPGMPTPENSELRIDHPETVPVGVDNSGECNSKPVDVHSQVKVTKTKSIGDYFQDEGNSQEPEEELLKYFKACIQPDTNVDTKLSNLKLLLERNSTKDTTLSSKMPNKICSLNINKSLKTKHVDLKNCEIPPSQRPQAAQNGTSSSIHQVTNTRRRVSFKNSGSILQIPNIHKTNFIFTPISPRPATLSKSSINASPFVFPRDSIFRGKFSTLPHNTNQSPVLPPLYNHSSPLKNISRSNSLSNTPSPSTNSRCTSNTFPRGHLTPQESSQELAESTKSSPLISPSSSSGVFLSPSSPISSCSSPAFSLNKHTSRFRYEDDSKISKSNSSLLHTLLTRVNGPEDKKNKAKDEGITNCGNKQKHVSLGVGADEIFYANSFSKVRSHSVPTLTISEVISPVSNTLPFPLSLASEDDHPMPEIKNTDLEALESVFDVFNQTIYGNNLLTGNISDDTVESGIHTRDNKESVESVISNLSDLFDNKELEGTDFNNKSLNVSRSNPNTPLVYNEGDDYKQLSLLSDDIELALNNLSDFIGCDDAFDELAKEVTDSCYKDI